MEQLCDKNKSGGLGKSKPKVSESSVENCPWSKCGSCSTAGVGDRQESPWSCACVAADMQEETVARYDGAEAPLLDEVLGRSVGRMVVEGEEGS